MSLEADSLQELAAEMSAAVVDLADEQQFSRELQERIPCGVVVAELNGGGLPIVATNPAADWMLRGSVVGQVVASRVPEIHRAEHLAGVRRTIAGASPPAEYRKLAERPWICADGATRPFLTTVFEVRGVRSRRFVAVISPAGNSCPPESP
ncbi:MAG: hypothetical protein GY719_25975 [bacterium]|nr:hypothetical protein [bacterium]